MKKIAVAVALTVVMVSAAVVYLWNQGQNPPQTLAGLGPELEASTVVYEIIEDTPLVIVDHNGSLYLDTIGLEYPVRKWPPGAVWELTGRWFEIGPPELMISADLTPQFGPHVLFGVIQDSRVSYVDVRRDGKSFQTLAIASPGFILQAGSVKYGDEIVFLEEEGGVIDRIELEQKTFHPFTR